MLASSLTLSVVSHGHGPLLAALLRELDGQPRLRGVNVIVTLNLDGETLADDAYPNLDLRLIRNARPRGFGANHNAAFRHCGTPWFAVLNPDLRLDGEEPFSHLLGADVPAPDIAVMAPAVVAPDGGREDSVRTNLTFASLLARRFRHDQPVWPRIMECSRADGGFFWLAGMFLLLRSDAYAAVGGFDERFHLYCEDYDLCARLWLSGGRLRVDNAVGVIHAAQRDSHRSLRHLRWHFASLFKVWTSRAFWSVVRRADGRGSGHGREIS